MFIHGHIGLKNSTKGFFAESLGKILFEVKINSIYRRIYIGLNRRYSVFLRQTDNLFDIIHENKSLIQDLIAERANEVSSGEHDK